MFSLPPTSTAARSESTMKATNPKRILLLLLFLSRAKAAAMSAWAA